MATPEPSPLRILVVDDETFVLNLTLRILANLGHHQVTTANDGMRALEALVAAPEPFDVVICDLNMPGMDGVEFMRHAADRDFTGGIIFLSGEDLRMLDTARDLARAFDLNILGAIPKPLKPDALRELLKRFRPREKPKAAKSQVSISEQELRAGIEGKELQLVFQPKVHIGSGRITGVETLARWAHPDRGMLGPGTFIPLAEKLGLIDELTDAIYRKAMDHAGDWLASGIELTTSVNFPINIFSRPGFSDFLIGIARTEGVDPSKVVLEITESQVMQNALNCLEVLMRLRLKKFGLSIDDFGTGHSSLEQLKRIPFTELKVDRAFVYGATDDDSARAILESSVELAKKLKMKIVAEGVETRADWDLVTALGCDYVQGYYCAKPMTDDALRGFLAGWKGPH